MPQNVQVSVTIVLSRDYFNPVAEACYNCHHKKLSNFNLYLTAILGHYRKHYSNQAAIKKAGKIYQTLCFYCQTIRFVKCFLLIITWY